jgi:hypothetical protein
MDARPGVGGDQSRAGGPHQNAAVERREASASIARRARASQGVDLKAVRLAALRHPSLLAWRELGTSKAR